MLRYVALIATLAPLPAFGEDQLPTAQPQSVKFDILVKQPSEPKCEQNNSDEIVVCAAPPEDPEQYRLRRLKDEGRFSNKPLKAEAALSENATLSVEGDAGSLGGGSQSKRLMVRLKIKF